MSKTSLEIDRTLLRQASAILGTRSVRDTVNSALGEIVARERRRELIEHLKDRQRFDFDGAEQAWGGDE